MYIQLVSSVSQMVLVVKNQPTNAGDIRYVGSILGFGRSPGGGSGNPFQYSCLENPMDRGAWGATLGFIGSQSRTRLKQLSTHAHLSFHTYCTVFLVFEWHLQEAIRWCVFWALALRTSLSFSQMNGKAGFLREVFSSYLMVTPNGAESDLSTFPQPFITVLV